MADTLNPIHVLVIRNNATVISFLVTSFGEFLSRAYSFIEGDEKTTPNNHVFTVIISRNGVASQYSPSEVANMTEQAREMFTLKKE